MKAPQKQQRRLNRAPRVFRGYRPMIRSRHPSHDVLREDLPRQRVRSVVRLGSTWATDRQGRIEINRAEAVHISANKNRMKAAFIANHVMTSAYWVRENMVWIFKNNTTIPAPLESTDITNNLPVVAKSLRGSRGRGNTLIKNAEQLDGFIANHDVRNYIFEKFYNYSREYRLHVTKNGCFYTCRKMLRNETPDNQRWFRNDSNSVWILEDNPQFDKPTNWNAIVAESVKALLAVGLDIGAIDVRVQSASTDNGGRRENPKFIILETNSAPSFGEVTAQKYIAEIPKLIQEKIQANENNRQR